MASEDDLSLKLKDDDYESSKEDILEGRTGMQIIDKAKLVADNNESC